VAEGTPSTTDAKTNYPSGSAVDLPEDRFVPVHLPKKASPGVLAGTPNPLSYHSRSKATTKPARALRSSRFGPETMAAVTLYPLRFRPLYKQYLWGGRRFETHLGRKLPPDGPFAESWEVADHGQDQSIVEAGPLAGTTLHELVARFGHHLLGRHHPQPRFPLLLKYLDANQPLSVQVHPDDALARRMGLDDPGKTEAWCVLHAEPGSLIWAGFREPIDPERLRRAVAEGKLEACLHRFSPAPGQCVFLPAGTVHALGQGLLVAEIQQTSDNTFRLYDWNRVGPDGRPRPLHVEEAIQAINYDQGPVQPAAPRPGEATHIERLVRCDKFVLDRLRLATPQMAGGDGRCHILTVIQGAIHVEGDPEQAPLRLGSTVLLPAALSPVQLEPLGDETAVLLDACLP